MVMESFDQMFEDFISLCIINYNHATFLLLTDDFLGSGQPRIDPT
jgi:hypothetical protein